MNPSHSIKELVRLHAECKKMKEAMIGEMWAPFSDQLIHQIYLELCAKIPETKMIALQQLFNKTVHPSANQKELMNQYIKLGVPVEKVHHFFPILQGIWTQMVPIWKPVEVKFMNSLIPMYKQVSELEQNKEVMDLTFTTYQNMIHRTSNLKELEKELDTITDSTLQQNVMDLYEKTKEILTIHYQLV